MNPHPKKFQSSYNDHSHNLMGIKLTYEESKESYTCWKCGEWMGCASCLGDITDIICTRCRYWANRVSETVHGKMVLDRELRAHAMKLVIMLASGAINEDDYEKLWSEGRQFNRPAPLAKRTLDVFK